MIPYANYRTLHFAMLQTLFCNIDIIHNSNLQNSMFYKASYPRGVKDIRIVLGPRSWVSKNIGNSRFAKGNPISVQSTL